MSEAIDFSDVVSKMNNDDDAAAKPTVATLTERLDADGEAAYISYAVGVDTSRELAALEATFGDFVGLEKAKKLWLGEKAKGQKACEKLPGNLPMFRAAYPVEDRDGVWILPAEKAAVIGIDYDDEDPLNLPVVNGEKYDPVEDGLGIEWSELSAELEAVEDGEYEEADDEPEMLAEGLPNPETMTVADLKDFLQDVDTETECELLLEAEQAGKDRKTAKQAIESRLAAVEKARAESEADEETVEDDAEPVEADSVEAAKIEALKALTETLNKTAEAIESL